MYMPLAPTHTLYKTSLLNLPLPLPPSPPSPDSHRRAIMAVGDGRVITSLVTTMGSTVEKVHVYTYMYIHVHGGACTHMCTVLV